MTCRKTFLIAISILFLLYNQSMAGHIRKRKIKKLFKHSAIMNDHFTGFALFDLDDKKMVFGLNDSIYFIPASNTKLFTYYVSFKMLGDSVPALKYVVRGDSLIFWGTGDPSFLHNTLNGINGFNFLKNSHKKLFYSAGNYTGTIYGYGWGWDDYNEDYQAEINELAVENNLALFYTDSRGELQVKPAHLKEFVQCDSTFHPVKFTVKRDFLNNRFVYPPGVIPTDYKQQVPWQTSATLTATLLRDTLKNQLLKSICNCHPMLKLFMI